MVYEIKAQIEQTKLSEKDNKIALELLDMFLFYDALTNLYISKRE